MGYREAMWFLGTSKDILCPLGAWCQLAPPSEGRRKEPRPEPAKPWQEQILKPRLLELGYF